MSVVSQIAAVLVLVVILLLGVGSMEWPLQQLSRLLQQFNRDIRAIKATGADPKSWWDFYRIYRKYKKGELK